jgi:hypothetical protein
MEKFNIEPSLLLTLNGIVVTITIWIYTRLSNIEKDLIKISQDLKYLQQIADDTNAAHKKETEKHGQLIKSVTNNVKQLEDFINIYMAEHGTKIFIRRNDYDD